METDEGSVDSRTHLTAEQALLLTRLGRRPELKVVVVGVLDLLLALARREGRKVDVDRHRLVIFARPAAEEEELAARVGGDGLNGGNVKGFSEVVGAPGKSLVGRVEDLAGRHLITERVEKERKEFRERESLERSERTHLTMTMMEP